MILCHVHTKQATKDNTPIPRSFWVTNVQVLLMLALIAKTIRHPFHNAALLYKVRQERKHKRKILPFKTNSHQLKKTKQPKIHAFKTTKSIFR